MHIGMVQDYNIYKLPRHKESTCLNSHLQGTHQNQHS
jgi:hypothetical protein